MSEAADLGINADAYGPMLRHVDMTDNMGQPSSMLMVNPLTLLQAAFEQGGSFTELILDTLTKHPSSPERPWKLILYSDEVVPGNPIGYNNLRKVWVAYYSFAEFGPVTLQREEAWLPQMVNRSDGVSKFSAGISQVFVAIIKEWCCKGCDV